MEQDVNKNNRQEYNNDEIDLIQLFKMIGNAISNFFKYIWKLLYSLIMAIFYFFVRNIIAFIIIFILGVTWYLIDRYVFNAKEQYSSSMIVRSNVIAPSVAIDYINSLGGALTNKAYKELSEQLGLDSAVLSNLASINAYWLIDQDADGVADYVDFENDFVAKPNDSTFVARKIQSEFYVEIKYNDKFQLNDIDKKIIKYISEKEFVIKQQKLKLTNLENRIDKLLAEESKLDTTRKKYNENIFNNILPQISKGQMVFLNGETSNTTDIKLFYPDILNLHDKYIATYSSLENSKEPFSIKKSFVYRENVSVTNIENLLRHILILLIPGTIIILIIENWKNMMELRKKSLHKEENN